MFGATDHEVGEALVGDVDARLNLENVEPEVDDATFVDGDAPVDLRVRTTVGEVVVREHWRRDDAARPEQLVPVDWKPNKCKILGTNKNQN